MIFADEVNPIDLMMRASGNWHENIDWVDSDNFHLCSTNERILIVLEEISPERQ